MHLLLIMIQLVVALGILNVWLVRRRRATPYRGGGARNMVEEFQSYGLPAWSVPVVGFFKVALAGLILLGRYREDLVALGASGLGLFMLVAVFMHIKIKDPLKATLPSLIMLLLCGILAFSSSPDILALASGF